MNTGKAFASIKRGLEQAIRHRKSARMALPRPRVAPPPASRRLVKRNTRGV